jgi:hypothetical protein
MGVIVGVDADDDVKILMEGKQLDSECVGGGDLAVDQYGCVPHGSRLLCSPDQGPELVLPTRLGAADEYLLT